MENDTVTTMEVSADSEINNTIAKAVALAAETDSLVQFDFNEVKVTVVAGSDPSLIYRDWSRGMSGYHKEVVGPYPPAELSAETLASDGRIKAENEARWAASQAEHDRKMDEKRIRLEAEIGDEPIRLRDGAEADWRSSVEKNTDPYGAAVMRYAEKWARLMQVRVRAGGKLEEIAGQASHDADDEGITGFMYGCAVSTLAHCWGHGEQLRRWHNTETQLRDEGEEANASGGVLNPAVLCIGS